MKTIIHVNQNAIRRNIKTRRASGPEPVITAKTYKSNDYGHEAVIYGQDGKEAARVVYRPFKPLGCGARLWIETQNEVDVIVNEYSDPTTLKEHDDG